MNEYSFEVDATDTHVAFDCEADRAEREKLPDSGHIVHHQAGAHPVTLRDQAGHVGDGIAQVQRRLALALGRVNAFLRDDVRNARAVWLNDHIGDG